MIMPLEDGTAEINLINANETDVVIPSEIEGYRITSIGSLACYNRRNITAVTIPDSVTKLDENPFALCNSLERINISEDKG